LRAYLTTFTDRSEGRPRPPRLVRRIRERRSNDPAFDVAHWLYRLSGVDLTVLEGIDSNTALVILSEVGPDVSRFPTAKHFSSWLGLSPLHRGTGGKIKSRRVKRGASRAGRAFRLAVLGCHHAKHALGAFYRRIQARAGAAKAIVATARKLAERVYRLLEYGAGDVCQGMGGERTLIENGWARGWPAERPNWDIDSNWRHPMAANTGTRAVAGRQQQAPTKSQPEFGLTHSDGRVTVGRGNVYNATSNTDMLQSFTSVTFPECSLGTA